MTNEYKLKYTGAEIDDKLELVGTLQTELQTIKEQMNSTIRYTAQELTDAQKEQARENIGANSLEVDTDELVDAVLAKLPVYDGEMED